MDTPHMMVGVDKRVDYAIQNAASYQDVHHTMDGLSHQQICTASSRKPLTSLRKSSKERLRKWSINFPVGK